MRLRTYLAKRAIHTVITLVVVLVLLFVLFRLMPGDPTRFFIRPGQTPEERQQILVDFGFAKWAPAPGNGYRAQFEERDDGFYQVNVTVRSGENQTLTLYVGHAKDVPDQDTFYVRNATISKDGFTDLWRPNPGDTLQLDVSAIRPKGTSGWQNGSGNATVSSWGGVEFNVSLSAPSVTPDNTTYTLSADIPTAGLPVGAYAVRIQLVDQDNTTNVTEGLAAFSLNPADLSPFSFPDDEWHVVISKSFLQATVTVNITGPGGIAAASIDVIAPDGSLQVDGKDMSHPLVAVRNNPLEEFAVYMRNMLVLDFGKSFYTRQPVWDEIAKRVGPTLLLFGAALVIGALLGIGIGAVMAWRRGSNLELGTIVVSLFFNSMPVFWLGLVLLWLFAFTLNRFPLGGFSEYSPVTYCHSVRTEECVGVLGYVKDILWHMTLPLANLLIIGLAGSILLMRNSMLEVLGEDYIMTARAKGLSERSVMYRHAARNAMLPVVTAITLSVGGVISGGVLTETIFTWPGMGFYLVDSTLRQDFPAIQGAFFLLALITIISNLVADVMYAFLDPRVRL